MRMLHLHSMLVFMLVSTTSMNAWAQSSANSQGMCSRMAQIRQNAANGFERARGGLVARNAEGEIYEATIALTGAANDFINVPRSGKSSPFHMHLHKYRDGVSIADAQEFLPRMRQVVEGCYGKEVSISCADNRCSAHSLTEPREIVFTWNVSGTQAAGFSIFRSRPLPSDTKWLTAATASATASPPRNELLEACSRTHVAWATKNNYRDHWTDTRIARWCGCISRNLAPVMTTDERQAFIADAPGFVDKIDEPPPGQQRNWRLYSPMGACQS